MFCHYPACLCVSASTYMYMCTEALYNIGCEMYKFSNKSPPMFASQVFLGEINEHYYMHTTTKTMSLLCLTMCDKLFCGSPPLVIC